MSFLNYLAKVTTIFNRISFATPDIIEVFKCYKKGIKDNKLTYDELLALFDKLVSAVLKICPELYRHLR